MTTSRRKALRRLRRWNRYIDRYMMPGIVVPPGHMRAWNRMCDVSYTHINNRWELRG